MSLEPFSIRTLLRIAGLYYLMEMYDMAQLHLREVLELEPNNLRASLLQAAVYAEIGELSEGFRLLECSTEASTNFENLAMKGYLHALDGDKIKSLETIGRMRNFGAASASFMSSTARIYFALGEYNTGYPLLEKALDGKSNDLIALHVDPRWKKVRSQSRFLEMVERKGPA